MILFPQCQQHCLYQWHNKSSLTALNAQAEMEAFYLKQAHRFVQDKGVISEPVNWDVAQVIDVLHQALISEHERMLAFANTCHQALGRNDFAELTAQLDALSSTSLRKQAHDQINEIYALINEEYNAVDLIEQVLREHCRDAVVKPSMAMRKECLTLQIDRLLDLVFRCELFHLAARYWEGQYIVSTRQQLLCSNTLDNQTLALRRICMLTPCVVATINTAPTLIRTVDEYHHQTRQHGLGIVDLLLIDEAGQANIHSAFALTAMAQRIVAVGDVDQIAPIRQPLTIPIEQAHYWQAGVSDADYANFSQRMITPMTGSILHVLQQKSAFSDDAPGLMLRGRYRCHQQIIELCNQMVYDNQLFLFTDARQS